MNCQANTLSSEIEFVSTCADRQDCSAVSRIAGSFRDPSGFVFSSKGDIFRTIDEDTHQVLSSLAESGLLSQLIKDHVIVGTDFVTDPDLLNEFRLEFPGTTHFLSHRRIEQISYPYEWSVSMLADAGILTLDLQIELLKAGYSLKDATAYNIQFVDGIPVMIDVASIERPERLDVWIGLGQFLQMFVYPLMLCRYRGWDLRSYFLSNLNGREIGKVAQSFTWAERLRPRMLLDLTIPWWLHRRSESKASVDKAGTMPETIPNRANTNPQGQIFNLQRLQRKLKNLAAGFRPTGIWSQYTNICNYEPQAEQEKRSIVRKFLGDAKPRTVLDIGCNTGDYSFLAAECGARVTSVDGDHDAIETLYRRLRKKPAAIQPMVVDLANPSPAIGYMNVERDSFLDRSKPDCVLALALIHHLWVSANMSTESISRFFHSLTHRDLILEFVPTDDSMFQRLMNYRVNLFRHINLDHVIDMFSQDFQLKQQQPITGSKRVLLHFQKKLR